MMYPIIEEPPSFKGASYFMVHLSAWMSITVGRPGGLGTELVMAKTIIETVKPKKVRTNFFNDLLDVAFFISDCFCGL